MRARTLLALLTLVVLLITAHSPFSQASPKSLRKIRNVLFIMGDDHAPHVLGAYGNTIVRTPILDGLAKNGARFDHAYANSPICTPSRQSIITGKYPHAVGVTLLSTPLSEDQVTIAEHLKQLGYQTGAVGKMHFINEKLKHGFDYRLDHPDYINHLNKHPPRKPPEGMKVKPKWRPFRDPARIWLNADMLPVGVYDEDSEGTYFARRAIDFLRSNKDNPFCLWLSFYEPHSPFDFPIEYAGKYDPAKMPLPKVGPEDARWIPKVFKDLSDEDKRGIIASYYTSVEYMDKNIGLVLDELKRLNLDESTLVIYIGDHGYLLGHHGRFEKHMMWEPAVSTPLIINNATLFGRGRSIDALVELVDLVPTILESLGMPPMKEMHGKSLVSLLKGETKQHREFVFSEYLPDNKAMIRTRGWKYIFSSGKHDLWSYETGNGAPGRHQHLYNVIGDPQEFHNLAEDPKYAKVVKELRQRMLHVFMATDPRAPKVRREFSIEEQLEWFLEPPEKKGT